MTVMCSHALSFAIGGSGRVSDLALTYDRSPSKTNRLGPTCLVGPCGVSVNLLHIEGACSNGATYHGSSDGCIGGTEADGALAANRRAAPRAR